MDWKLFLTSAGLPKETRENFIKLLPKAPHKIKLCFIPTAADPEKNKSYVGKDIKTIKKMGMNISEIDLKNKNEDSLLSDLSRCDVIYIEGGNTFYLLDHVRKSGFDKIIKQLLDNEKIYVGVSAGSIIAGVNIELAGWKHFDRNIVELKDLKGLSLVPFVPFVHYEEKYNKLLNDKVKEIDYSLYALNDKQAVLCVGDKYEIVGEGRKIIYKK
ncbi:MAG: hypothetical protein A2857_01330 [Candidatus Levybacteria bacterium RIFCSPHIGHO2_01_FULL_36_15]|nr:MAG: hypothetical protein A2857_01330 [Candidatus Levybacteria bacterium RIFCSPHIGHO2_01_FULL_36_15]OGH38787.1 MAG: hypothetical protein A2905_02380 [Candidatus Levybacteria bacterium RIFCSPLOWO2_01_FULL_36_10]